MPIQLLPQPTVRVLGATQVLTDPVSLVKELIDNALDANATSIAIEIHSNTLDVVQVRDNGHGVAPDDRVLLAKRYSTSKITHEGDLDTIGGASLGFRGEALASAAELSGSTTISTRIEGEQVAAVLKIDQQGSIVGQDRASLPVGTTVRITDFLKANPVRRQVSLKSAENALKKLKRVLQGYAFARLNTRLALRVLKAKDSKSDWIFAPTPCGTAEDAAFKVVGAACASQCTWTVLDHQGFTLQAFLPSSDAIVNKVSNIGAFISVDRRPVSSVRGVFKQILKVFRETLRSHSSQLGNMKDLFLFLNIDCPTGSYDVNIEPAKDDVLFEDSAVVMDAARKLFNTIYGHPEASGQATESQNHLDTTPVPLIAGGGDYGSSLQLSTIPTGDETEFNNQPFPLGPAMPNNVNCTAHNASSPRRNTMYGYDKMDFDLPETRPTSPLTEDDVRELRRAREDMTISNPWVLTKLNSSQIRPMLNEPGLIDSHNRSILPQSISSPNMEVIRLLTPRPSSPIPINEGIIYSAHRTDLSHIRDLGRSIPELTPRQQQGTPISTFDRSSHSEGSASFRPTPLPAYGHDLGIPEDSIQSSRHVDDLPVVNRSQHGPRKRARIPRLEKPFVPPTRKQPEKEKVWFDHLENIDRSKVTTRRGVQRNIRAAAVEELEAMPSGPHDSQQYHDIRDFLGHGKLRQSIRGVPSPADKGSHERPNQNSIDRSEHPILDEGRQQTRKMTALAGHGFVPASELAALESYVSSSNTLPRHALSKRKTSDRCALAELSTNTNHDQELVAEHISQEQTTSRAPSRRKSSNKLGRSQSSRLPLEYTPPARRMHTIVFDGPTTSSNDISELVRSINARPNPGFGQETHEARSAFDNVDLQDLTNDLHNFLVKAGGDSDTDPGELFRELSSAFALHRARLQGEEEVTI